MVQEIPVDELPNKLTSGAQLIDVRPLTIFNLTHVKTAKNIPLNQLPNRLTELDKNKPVYLICNHGNSSLIAAQFLEENGFQAISIAGGTEAFKTKYPELTQTTL